MDACLQSLLKNDPPFDRADRLLVAVSGGADSMALLHYLHALGYHVQVAHAAFGLRGTESENERNFVQTICHHWQIPCHVKEFDTTAYASANHLSIQMAARALRYAWFEDLRVRENLDWILTAHHLDDSIETFFINLLRGTGIRGLTGLAPKEGRLVRPLLFCTKDQILRYAHDQKLAYCIDSSNESPKYLRNRIRNEILPILLSCKPSFSRVMQTNFQNLRDEASVLEWAASRENKEVVSKDSAGIVRINLRALRSINSPDGLLFRWLEPYGFSRGQFLQILSLLDKPTGRQIHGKKFSCLRDRDDLVFFSQPDQPTPPELIYESHPALAGPFRPDEVSDWDSRSLPGTNNPMRAVVDADKLKFPLVLRPWKNGDAFVPLGMTGRKKISDFLTDCKLPRNQKSRVRILESDHQIVWVVGYRLSESFKVNSETTGIFVLNGDLMF